MVASITPPSVQAPTEIKPVDMKKVNPETNQFIKETDQNTSVKEEDTRENVVELKLRETEKQKEPKTTVSYTNTGKKTVTEFEANGVTFSQYPKETEPQQENPFPDTSPKNT